MKSNKIYFISGVCGSGKTTQIPHLKKLLQTGKYDIRDFDEFGVPAGGGREWLISETRKWLGIGTENARKGISTIICGFARPMDIDNLKEEGMPEIEVILLDADSKVIRSRLIERYSKNGVFDEHQTVVGMPVNDFIESNVNYVNTMRAECMNARCPIVDTTLLGPEAVARLVISYV